MVSSASEPRVLAVASRWSRRSEAESMHQGSVGVSGHPGRSSQVRATEGCRIKTWSNLGLGYPKGSCVSGAKNTRHGVSQRVQRVSRTFWEFRWGGQVGQQPVSLEELEPYFSVKCKLCLRRSKVRPEMLQVQPAPDGAEAEGHRQSSGW